ncbi:hypothetical protein ACWGMA_47205 [Streptomyces asiaticus]|nr:hypothetical protein [Streptomyces antimycoticus]
MKIDTQDDPGAGNPGLISLIDYRLPSPPRPPEEEDHHAHAGLIAGP